MKKADVKTTSQVAGAAEPARQGAGRVSGSAKGKRARLAEADTYAELKVGVKKALAAAQGQMESSRAEGYWETGRMITAHLLRHKERAGYGRKTICKLARELEAHYTLLYRCVRFAKAFPIFAGRQKLTWTHYRALLVVKDDTARWALEAEAIKRGWNSRETEERVARVTGGDQKAGGTEGRKAGGTEGTGVSNNNLLEPMGGTVGVYRIKRLADGLAVDFGFASYLALTAAEVRVFAAGSRVRVDASGRVSRAEETEAGEGFTYRAKILEVVDGDTLWLQIYEGPRRSWIEKVRLRGLDCPEMITRAGRRAKRYVQALTQRAVEVNITTTKPDKWDRYLSDVFLKMGPAETIYLNNDLLASGHAVRKDEWALTDWDKDILRS